MKQIIAIALLFCLVALPVAGAAAEEAPKVGIVESIDNPQGQNGGKLFAEFLGGILIIRYEPTFKGPAELVFTVAAENRTQLLREGGTLTGLAKDGLIDPAYEGGPAYNRMTLPIRIDPAVRELVLPIQAADGDYVTKAVPVLWLPTASGPAISADIWPGEDITIGVGQEIELGIDLKGDYTDRRYRLVASSYETVVGVSGVAIIGVEEGEQVVVLQNGDGDIIGSIKVTVQEDEVRYEPPAKASPSVQKRKVLTTALSVYPSASFTRTRVGTLPEGHEVSVLSDNGQWAQLLGDVWVRSQNLAR